MPVAFEQVQEVRAVEQRQRFSLGEVVGIGSIGMSRDSFPCLRGEGCGAAPARTAFRYDGPVRNSKDKG